MTEDNGIPGRTRYKSLYARFEGRFGDRRCGLCGKPLPPRRRKWCSDRCVGFIGKLGLDWSRIRHDIEIRDKHTCRMCGRKAKSHKFGKGRRYWSMHEEGFPVKSYKRYGGTEYEFVVRTSGSKPWVVDHILPIALGGSEFDPENLQLLCPWCNEKKTAQDAANIAARRQELKRAEALGKITKLDAFAETP